MFGAGPIGPVSGGNRITLSDIAGSDSFEVADADGAILFKVKSDGTIQTRKGIEKAQLYQH